ncbi:MAG: hypothetical protein PHO31_01455 [Candidatus Pacebacteria bacterium]|mgnify:FL=1|nr:hypothetical protein [Candidatus Paceibacterota bacterium]
MLSTLQREFKQINILLIFLFLVYSLSLFIIYSLRYPPVSHNIFIDPPEISNLEAKEIDQFQWEISIKIKNPNANYSISDVLYEINCLDNKNLEIGKKEGKVNKIIKPGEEITWQDTVNCGKDVSLIKFRLFKYSSPEGSEESLPPPANQ